MQMCPVFTVCQGVGLPVPWHTVLLCLRFSAHVVVYFVHEHLLDLLDTLVAIHHPQLVLLPIVVEHLGGLIEVDHHPSAHRFSGIVRTLIELTSIHITSIGHLWRAKFGVIDVLIRLTEHSGPTPLK